MMDSNVFSGRVIFDHLPKTGGIAINRWLQESLGADCVTDPLMGNHQDLIRRYGGTHSVICAHIGFNGWMDPRYQYVTCLREPVDRLLSSLFFSLSNFAAHELGAIQDDIRRFVESEGDVMGPGLISLGILDDRSKLYVDHFRAVVDPFQVNDEEMFQAALAAIDRYDVWGLYERMPEFLADFAALIDLPAPARIARENVTANRPKPADLSAKFRKRLEQICALDIEFYRAVQDRYDDARRRWRRPLVAASRWRPLTRPDDRVVSAPEFTLVSATIHDGGHRTVGSTLSFIAEFSLAVEAPELEAGIFIMDEDRRLAFKTDTTLMGLSLRDLAAGTHSLTFTLNADLPEGDYSVGFFFLMREGDNERWLAWCERVIGLRLALEREIATGGYVALEADAKWRRLCDRIVRPVEDARGGARLESEPLSMTAGETTTLRVTLFNESEQGWDTSVAHPIHLSYRWLDEGGCVAVLNGWRTGLPEARLPAGACLSAAMRVEAPDRAGRYRLQIVPVQEGICWFDERGFTPLEIELAVEAAGAHASPEIMDALT